LNPLKELWAYRELLYFLIWRDVMVRYKQTAFGCSMGDYPTRVYDACL
jgi:ABC-type polysaccharide/polyol phosphate export permease